MILEPVRPFRSRDVSFALAREEWEIRAYFALRRQIFCVEQALFDADDSDAIDAKAVPIVAVSRVAGMPDQVVGVVRIWQEESGAWWGGRLATHPDFRKNGSIGSGLIRLAVSTACERGCTSFRATVQPRNVRLFERLHWRSVGTLEACGVLHALMDADLAFYGGKLAAPARSSQHQAEHDVLESYAATGTHDG